MTEPPITRSEWIALHMIRQGKEQSRALQQDKYRDPSTQEKSMHDTKEAEDMLAVPLDNWIRWGRGKSYLPASFKCPLGFMYKPGGSGSEPVDEPAAVRFNAIVQNLPERHRRAFVMHEIGRGADKHRIVIIKGRNQAAQLLGVQLRQYHYLVNQAVNMVLTRW